MPFEDVEDNSYNKRYGIATVKTSPNTKNEQSKRRINYIKQKSWL